MPRTKISEFSATAASNTDIDSINIAENCPPSGINDAIRELMAQLKDFQTGAVGDSFNGPVGTTTAAAGAFTTLSSTGNTTLGDASGDSVTINGTATFANANPTLSAGTANGVAYLNGSKVVTSGSALTFDGTNFATTGSGTLKNLLFSGGTLPAAGNPSIALRSSDNVIYHQSGSGNTIVMLDSAQNTMQSIGATAQIWNISNSEQMRLTSTGLGIGTSSPSGKLHVNGIGYFGNTGSSDTQLRMGALDASNTYFQAISGDGTTAKGYVFYNGSSVGLRLDSSGNLGLGVTPSAWGGSYKGFQVAATGVLASNGVNGTTLSHNAYYDGTNDKYLTTGAASRVFQFNGGIRFDLAPSGTAGNAITFTQAMTLDSSGNLLVGATSAHNFGIPSIQAGGSNANAIISVRRDTTSSADQVLFYNPNGNVGGISTSGSLTSYNVTSDQRLKENIVDADSASSLIDSLQVRKFDWKTDQTHQRYGFIAQELVTVAPEAVYQPDDTEQMMAVDYSKLVPMLVKEIQSLRVRVAQLESN